MTTDQAQRRLLESLGALQQTPGGITGLLIGMPSAVLSARLAQMPELAATFEAFTELAEAVRADLTEGAPLA